MASRQIFLIINIPIAHNRAIFVFADDTVVEFDLGALKGSDNVVKGGVSLLLLPHVLPTDVANSKIKLTGSLRRGSGIRNPLPLLQFNVRDFDSFRGLKS